MQLATSSFLSRSFEILVEMAFVLKLLKNVCSSRSSYWLTMHLFHEAIIFFQELLLSFHQSFTWMCRWILCVHPSPKIKHVQHHISSLSYCCFYLSRCSEHSIVSARASVMIYDNGSNKWIPSGSSQGLSKVHIYYHSVNNTFRVVGRKLQDHEVWLKIFHCKIASVPPEAWVDVDSLNTPWGIIVSSVVMLTLIKYTSIYLSSGRFGGRCKFVNMRFVGWHVCKTGKQCHVILFVSGYSLQQFRRRYGNRLFELSTIIFFKWLFWTHWWSHPTSDLMIPSKVCCPKPHRARK
jgi:hypothetical protein